MAVDKDFMKSALGELAAENEIANEKVARIVTTQEERDESTMPERKLVYMHQLVTFPHHPFHVRDDADMQKLMDSVRKSGIRTPIEVIATGERNEKGEDTYYIVAGHRRCYVAQQIYPNTQRLEVRIQSISMDEAIIAMTESNLLTRETLLPCERGNAFRMEMDAKNRILGRPKDEISTQSEIALKSRSEIGEKNGLKGRQVQQYIRLSYLIPQLQDIVDSGKMGVKTGVELSFLSDGQQVNVVEGLELCEYEHYPSVSQAKAVRKLSKAGTLDVDSIVEILDVPKPNQMEHIKYAPRTSEFVSKVPVYMNPEKWGQKEFQQFIDNAIDCYVQNLNEAHQLEIKREEAEAPKRAWERPRNTYEL